MGWIDRKYSSRPQQSGWRDALRWLTSGSVYLGEWFGISVRVHAMLLVFVAFNLLFANGPLGIGLGNAITSSLILFVIVLLHEFGHCFAARHVGGRADHILLWPLGGLAYVDAPKRPGPTFFTAFGGPLVNIVICALTGGALLAMSGGNFGLPVNPLAIFGGGGLQNLESWMLISNSNVAYYLWWIYSTSYFLLCFNLLPIFPLDGGRLAQALLWPKLGFYQSMEVSCNIGIIGAIAMGLVGIFGNWFLLFIAISGYQTCYMTKMTLRESANAAYEAERFSDGGSFDVRLPRLNRKPKTQRPRDDRKTWRDYNPLEMLAKRRRRKQFERLMRDD